jgi:hypothetical protein
MSASEIPFQGMRVRYDRTKSYDELVAALLADIGERPAPIDEIAKAFDSWESYEQEVQSHVGPSGFMLFGQFNHGARPTFVTWHDCNGDSRCVADLGRVEFWPTPGWAPSLVSDHRLDAVLIR